MTRCRPEDLSTRTDTRELVARDPFAPGLVFEPVLTAEARADAWRIVEAFSLTGEPFELELSWSSGSGTGARAVLTAAHAVRVCVLARGLRVRAANLADRVHRVGVTVADGFAATRNQLQLDGALDDTGPALLTVPAFAERLRVEVADDLHSAATQVRLLDGLGTTRSAFAVADQPADGVFVGGTHSVEVELGASVDFRAVFLLSL